MNLKGEKDKTRPGDSLGATQPVSEGWCAGEVLSSVVSWRLGMKIHVAAVTQRILMCWKPQKCLRMITWKNEHCYCLTDPMSFCDKVVCREDEGKEGCGCCLLDFSKALTVFSTVFSWRN